MTAVEGRADRAVHLPVPSSPERGEQTDRADRAGGVAVEAVTRWASLPVAEAASRRLLTAITEAVTQTVPGASWTSISIGDPAEPTDAATDSTHAQAADGAQWRAEQGPSHAAHRSARAEHTDDLTSDGRWPRLAELARGGETRGAFAVPLRADERTVGVMTLYSRAAGGIDTADRDRAVVLAGAVTSAIRTHESVQQWRAEAEHLTRAMATRAGIEQAKGIVMSRVGCSSEEAFAAIASLSQDRNVKLRAIAELIVASPTDASLDEPLTRALVRVRSRQPAPPARPGAPV